VRGSDSQRPQNGGPVWQHQEARTRYLPSYTPVFVVPWCTRRQ
jgi:hypothetical protein